MTGAHTPGEWVVSPPNGTGEMGSLLTYKGKPYKTHETVHVVDGDGFRKNVAHVYQGDQGIGSPAALAEQRANAVLIAAAPGMLDALREIRDTPCDHGEGFCPRMVAGSTLTALGVL